MVVIVLDCNQACWECSRNDCDMKDLFLFPDSIFNGIVLEALKSLAGQEIAENIPIEEVDLNLKKRAVALKIARDKYLGNLK